MILFNVVFVVVVVGLFADVCFQGGEGGGGQVYQIRDVFR